MGPRVNVTLVVVYVCILVPFGLCKETRNHWESINLFVRQYSVNSERSVNDNVKSEASTVKKINSSYDSSIADSPAITVVNDLETTLLPSTTEEVPTIIENTELPLVTKDTMINLEATEDEYITEDVTKFSEITEIYFTTDVTSDFEVSVIPSTTELTYESETTDVTLISNPPFELETTIVPSSKGYATNRLETSRVTSRTEYSAYEESELVTTDGPSNPIRLLRKECGFALAEDIYRDSRIVGGMSVDPYKFPWMLSVYYRYRYICGGTLITPLFVLTAAHCISRSDPRLISVRSFAELRLVDKKFINPKFWYLSHDAGLLKMTNSFKFSFPPVCIADLNPPAVGAPLSIIGRGRVKESGPLSDGLNFAHIEVLPDKLCSASYDKFFNPSFICAGNSSGIPDACQGDSGGPLLREIEGAWYQIGVVSFGEGCGRPQFPGVYSKVNLFFEWISMIVNAYSS